MTWPIDSAMKKLDRGTASARLKLSGEYQLSSNRLWTSSGMMPVYATRHVALATAAILARSVVRARLMTTLWSLGLTTAEPLAPPCSLDGRELRTGPLGVDDELEWIHLLVT